MPAVWLVICNTGSERVTGMSQVSRLVIAQLRSMGDIAIVATDALDHRRAPLSRVRGLIAIWWHSVRRLAATRYVYTTLSATWPGILKNLMVLLPVLVTRKRLVLHSHSGAFRRFYLSCGRWRRLCIRFLLARTTLIIVVHPRYLRHFRSTKTRVVAVTNGSEDFADGIDRTTPADPLRILYLSNLIRAKGLPEAVAAAQLLAGDGVAVHFVVAGADDDVRARDLPGSTPALRIECLGPVHEHATKASLYASADLLVLPTTYTNEALPLAVLEALSAGTPVVSTPFRALAEIVRPGFNGWHCARSAESIAAALRHYLDLDDSQRRTMRDNCRRDWERRFSTARFATDLRAALSSIV